MVPCLPENTESETIEDNLTNIKYRSKCLWIKNDIIVPVSYRGDEAQYQAGIFDMVKLPAGTCVEYLSYWEKNRTVKKDRLR